MAFEILTYEFMQRALIGGFLIAISCALVGTFLVLKRLSLLGDGLAHATFGGVALGFLLKINPIFTALAFAVIASLGIDKLMQRVKMYGESAIALILSFSIAFALVLIGISDSFDNNLFSYLFGSILTLNMTDLYLMSGLLVLIGIFLFFFYKDMVYLAFNEEVARVHKKNIQLINRIFIILTALTIVLAIRAVGILLISALLVVPALIGLRLGNSFKSSMVLAVIFSVIGIYLGIFTSYLFDLPAGAMIVMSLISLFLLSLLYTRFRS